MRSVAVVYMMLHSECFLLEVFIMPVRRGDGMMSHCSRCGSILAKEDVMYAGCMHMHIQSLCGAESGRDPAHAQQQ